MPLNSDSVVRFNQANPKRLTSLAGKRYELYKYAKTVREALALGALSADLQHDLRKGFLVTSPSEFHLLDRLVQSDMAERPTCKTPMAHDSNMSVRTPSFGMVLDSRGQKDSGTTQVAESIPHQGTKRPSSEMSPTCSSPCLQRFAQQPSSCTANRAVAARAMVRGRFGKLRRRSYPSPLLDLEAAATPEEKVASRLSPEDHHEQENVLAHLHREPRCFSKNASSSRSPGTFRRRRRSSKNARSNGPPVTVSSFSPPPRSLHAKLQSATIIDASPDSAVCRSQKPKNIAIPCNLPSQAFLSVCFRASEVAALIGLHCHGAAIHALVRCWGRHHRASLRSWERLTGGVSLPEMVFARHARSPVHAAVRAASRDGDGALPDDAAAKIKTAVQLSAPPALWQALTEEAMGQARRARGTRLEVTGLNAYEKKFGRQVVRRNMDALRRLFPIGSADRASVFAISGRVDGFEDVSGERWVVEHKRRQRRLFRHVPCYEEVQCQAYMAMTGTPACRWVQTLGPEVDVQSLARCPKRWACVEGRLLNVARLLRRLCSGSLCPPSAELESMHRAACDSSPSWPDGRVPVPGECHVDIDTGSPVDHAPHVASKTPNEAIYVENSVPPPSDLLDKALNKVQITHAETLEATPVNEVALCVQSGSTQAIETAPLRTRATHAVGLTEVSFDEVSIDASKANLSIARSSDAAVVNAHVTHVAHLAECYASNDNAEAQILHLATLMETPVHDTLKVMSPGTQVDSHQGTLYDNDASTTENDVDRSTADSTELDESEPETLPCADVSQPSWKVVRA